MIQEYKQIDKDGFVTETLTFDSETDVIPKNCKKTWSPELTYFLPKWNFEKFLINRKGEIVGRFSPEIAPQDALLVDAIKKELGN